MKQNKISWIEDIDLRVTNFLHQGHSYYAFYLNNQLESICVHTCDGSYVALKEEVSKNLENVLKELESE